jgi:hypothetical protein
VRIVTGWNKCRTDEFKVSWNRQGVPGTPGAPGEAGPPGPPGPAGGASVIGGGSEAAVSASAVTYIALSSPTSSATESEVAQAMPTAGTVANLRANSQLQPGCFHVTGVNCVSAFWHVTVMKNGAATDLQCDILGFGFFPVNPCFDGTHTVSYAAGDTISVQITPGTGTLVPVPIESPIRWTASFTSA